MSIKDFFINVKASLRGSNKNQQKAFFRILRFFAIMLILTILARGTAGATLPKITSTFATPGTVTNLVEVNGKLEYAKNTKIIAPFGLQVEELLQQQNTFVEQGQQIVLFDKKSTDLKIKVAIAELNILQVQYNTIMSKPNLDDSAVKVAEQALNFAISERDIILEKNRVTIDVANRRYQSAMEKLRRWLETNDSCDDAFYALQEEVNRAYDELRLAEQATTELSNSSEKAIFDAEQYLINAQSSYNTADKQTEQNFRKNYAEAQLMLIDIETKKETIAEMQALQKNDYYLLAPQSGYITEWNVPDDKLASTIIGTISDESKGFIFTFPLTEMQANSIGSDTKVSIKQKKYNYETTISHVVPQDHDSFNAIAVVPPNHVRYGTAQATITFFEKDYPMCVPSSAVRYDNSGAFVYVVVENQTILGLSNVIARVEITILEQSADVTAISGSLSGSKIVVSTTKPIKVGDRVRIIQ